MRLGYLLAIAMVTGSGSLAPQSTSPERQKMTLPGHDLFVPAGFKVSLFADNVGGVRSLALGPGGVVYAARPGKGLIIKLPDTNRDGVADTAITVASGLNLPFGIAFRGDTMYVSETNGVKRFGPGAAQPVQLISGLPGGGNHWTRTLVIGPDNHLYVAIGSSCNICEEADPRRAAVERYNLDGPGEQIFATGLRNSVGVAFNPSTGELWANNNDRDNLGDDLPPEHLNI